MYRHLGTSCPVGLETISRISKVYLAIFAMSRIMKITLVLSDYFWIDFRHFWADIGHFRMDFGHFHTDFG